MMNTIENSIHQFYLENAKDLEGFYPGIHKDLLVKEFTDFIIHKKYYEPQMVSHIHPLNCFHELDFYFKNLKKGVPLAYLAKKKYFYNGELNITSDVLIPRFETEILVEMALKKIKSGQTFRLMDIGAGSGNIFLAILRELDFPIQVHVVEKDPQAMALLKKNFYQKKYAIHPKTSITFECEDYLKKSIQHSCDLIVSNPPYIKTDHAGVHPQVKKFEPHQALFIDQENYNEWFHKFIKKTYDDLSDYGSLLMEGHEEELAEIGEMAKKIGYASVEVKKDLQQVSRFLVATKGKNE